MSANYIISNSISMFRILSLLLIMSFFINVNATADQASPKRVIKILSIDGGGVRGIIPSYILKELETRLPKERG